MASVDPALPRVQSSRAAAAQTPSARNERRVPVQTAAQRRRLCDHWHSCECVNCECVGVEGRVISIAVSVWVLNGMIGTAVSVDDEGAGCFITLIRSLTGPLCCLICARILVEDRLVFSWSRCLCSGWVCMVCG